MKVVLVDSDTMLKRHSAALPAHAGYSKHDFGWREILKAVGGKTLDVETEHLFDDQFNTGPIPGVSASGIRVMNNMVDDVIDDVRVTAAKCWYCGHCRLDVPDADIETPCHKKCEKGVYRRLDVKYPNRWATGHRVREVVQAAKFHTGKVATLTLRDGSKVTGVIGVAGRQGTILVNGRRLSPLDVFGVSIPEAGVDLATLADVEFVS